MSHVFDDEVTLQIFFSRLDAISSMKWTKKMWIPLLEYPRLLIDKVRKILLHSITCSLLTQPFL